LEKSEQEQSKISEIFKILSNPVNLEIIMFLSISPTYPRELSRILGRSETDISRRLKRLEKLGIVRGEWIRVSGGTARIYRLTVSDIRLDLAKGKIVIDGKSIDASVDLSCGIPPRITDELVGRVKEFNEIVANEWRTLYLWGPVGIGKTLLVSKSLSGEEKVFWHTVREWDGVIAVARKIACALGSLGKKELLAVASKPMPDPSDVIEQTIESLKGSALTLVFDDFHNASRELEHYILRIASSADGYRVVLVSREPPKAFIMEEGFKVIRLSPLDKEAVALIAKRAAGAEVDPDEVYEGTSGHPLLAKLYGISLKYRDVDYWIGAYESILSSIMTGLDPVEREVFTIIAIFPEPLSEDILGKMIKRGVKRALRRLVSRGLVYREDSGYTTHEFLKSIVRKSEEQPELLNEYVDSLWRDGYISLFQAIRYYYTVKDYDRIATVVKKRIETNDPSCMEVLSDYQMILEETVEKIRSERLKSYILFDLGLVSRLSGSHMAESYLTEAYQLSRLFNQIDLQVRALAYRAFQRISEGNLKGAMEDLVKAESLLGEVKDSIIAYIVYANLAKLYSVQGNFEKASEYVEKGKEAASKSKDYGSILWSLLGEATIYELKGDFNSALERLLNVKRLSEALGLWYQELHIDIRISQVLLSMGEYERALDQINDTKKLAEKYYMKVLMPWIDSIKATVLAALRRFDEAISICSELEGYGDMSLAQMVITYCSCASVYAAKGDMDKAREYAQKACRADTRQYRTLSRAYYSHLSSEVRRSLGTC